VRGLFVTATDTGVGKTTVACALVAAWARRGRRVAVMKPCETGGGDDAERLVRASGRALDLARVRPYAFALPASPAVAAAAAGARIGFGALVDGCRALADEADAVVVEGAGGLLVPLDERRLMADLAVALGLPLLIVARPSLGTVNHTLLTLEAARRRGLLVAGVVLSHAAPGAGGPDEPSNPTAIAHHGDARLCGTLPYLSDEQRDDPARLAAAAEAHLDVEALWHFVR
jgi:dethiobiotin synthetase